MDSRRQPPLIGAPRTIVRVVYGRNLRSIVIATGSLSALWTLLWAISSFRDVNLDKSNSYPKLATLSLVLGILYIVTCTIEVFGVFAAITQRLALVKTYAMGSVVSAILVIGAGLLEVIVHFVDKKDIVNECTTLATGASITFRFGLFGSTSQETLTAAEAASFCQDGWDRASWSSIISLLLEILLGVLFSIIAIAYYRQLLDPTSAANAFRAPSHQMRGDLYPEHYNPPFNAPPVPNLGYGAGPSAYAPPPGAPPAFVARNSAEDQDLGKPPGYDAGEYGSQFDGTHKENPFSDFDETRGAKAGEHDNFHV